MKEKNLEGIWDDLSLTSNKIIQFIGEIYREFVLNERLLDPLGLMSIYMYDTEDL